MNDLEAKGKIVAFQLNGGKMGRIVPVGAGCGWTEKSPAVPVKRFMRAVLGKTTAVGMARILDVSVTFLDVAVGSRSGQYEITTSVCEGIGNSTVPKMAVRCWPLGIKDAVMVVISDVVAAPSEIDGESLPFVVGNEGSGNDHVLVYLCDIVIVLRLVVTFAFTFTIGEGPVGTNALPKAGPKVAGAGMLLVAVVVVVECYGDVVWVGIFQTALLALNLQACDGQGLIIFGPGDRSPGSKEFMGMVLFWEGGYVGDAEEEEDRRRRHDGVVNE
ncbi:hypothetical protein K458DRAFT_392209 [Lentithecium fluviatile CBS 122367]|uniref:Uncharacterized protein n=1 Tax=Lentithecium fluviatile CBS 122367 TaxID=1168545 RepID=A0A6G1IRX5_9PLEO|nr:hypothetical protein K458DRAFT_392209 [Lentithecium fluviatile CBS 122367]